MDCGVRPICAITGMPRVVKNSMVSAMRAPPSIFTRRSGFLQDARGGMKACSFEAS